MSFEWQETTLGEVLTLQRGMDLPHQDRRAGIHPIVASTGIVGYHDTAPVKGAGVVIGRSGSIGGGQYIVQDFWPLNTTLWVKDFKGNDPRYCYYLLKSIDFSSMNAGSGVPTLNRNHLHPLKVVKPSLPMQKRIASLLGNLDDRITLLHETNATLEAIAQATFKSWFVDFEPVRAKSLGTLPDGMDEATSAIFPNEFEETELGRVPKGWAVATLGSVCNVTIGGLWGKDENESADLVKAISLRGVDLEHLREFGFAASAPIRWVKKDAMEKRRFSSDEVLIASSGAGPCGRALWAGAGFESFYGLPVIFSNFVKRFKCSSAPMALYVDRILAEMRETREIWHYINGTSIPNLDDKLLLASKKIIIPPHEILDAYGKFASSIYQKLYCQQAQALSSLRDTLLPRLISGQLRISDAEAELEKVTA